MYDDDDDYDYDLDDLLGEVDDDEDLLGRLRRRHHHSRRRGHRTHRSNRLSLSALSSRNRIAVSPRGGMGPLTVARKPPLIPVTPGVPESSALYIPLGLGTFVFANAGVTVFTFTTNPQKPVRPRRLWIDVAKTAGAAGILVSVTDIKIGTKSMLAGIGAIPASQFSAGAFARQYNLFDSAVPGINVAVSLSLSAGPGVGETVTASVSMDCDSLG